MASKFSAFLDRLPTAARFLMAGLVIIFISFLFPNHVKFKYDFEKDKRWKYQDLYAPFNFAILKSDKELEVDRIRVEKAISPYYEHMERVVEKEKLEFKADFKEKITQSFQDNIYDSVVQKPEPYIRYGLGIIDTIYSRGVIKISDQHLQMRGSEEINYLKNNTSRKKQIGNFYTADKAEDFITDKLPYSSLDDPDFLLSLLKDAINPNVIYSDTLTKGFRQAKIDEIPKNRGMVKAGDLIIRKDGIVSDASFQKLISLRDTYEQEVTKEKNPFLIKLGYILLTTLIVGVFLAFLRSHSRPVYKSFRQLSFMLLWLVVYAGMVYLIEKNGVLSLYVLPFCIVPIVIKNFYNARLALFTHIVIILISSFLCSLGYEFTFIQILAGIVAVLSNTRTRYWSKFFVSMLFIWIAYLVAFFGLSLIEDGSIFSLNYITIGWLTLNVFLTLLSYPLIPLLERMFGFTSEITLQELADLDKPLLKELSMKAPGTLQHSLQVANLSEAAASKIGANALLVKVAALYHDVGKTKQPEFYIENQNNGNPHDNLSYQDSAKIIIEHVTEGIKMAKKNRLPKIIVDFIRSHHGTTRVEYFYRKHLEAHPDEEVDEQVFRYPGPNPKTKEETIMMMADSLEAASKSLSEPTEEAIDDLVEKIVAGKITLGQFEDSELTFEELAECKAVFKKLLKSINHVRIKYPDGKKPK